MDNVEEKLYKQILDIPANERTQAQNNYVFNYENKKFKVPSKEDLERAAFILNHKGSNIKTLKDNGQWTWAEKILRNDRVARELGMKEGASMSYEPIQVKRTPEEVQKNFKFNWADAYNQLTEKKLKPTEKDAEKLDSFVKEHLDNFDDNSAMKLATDLKLWNPAREKFHEFLKTENGKQFQNYLEDVRKYKQDKEIERIWNDEDDEYKRDKGFLGNAKDVIGKHALNFMLPTSKEYAKRNYDKINSEYDIDGVVDMAKPLAFDAFSNLAMMAGGGANRYITGAEKVIRNPYLGAVASPIIHGAGDYLTDNKDAKGAALETAVGVGTNLMMPFYGQKAYNKLDKILPDGLVTNKTIIQNKVDDAVNRYKDYIEAVNNKAIVPRLKKADIGASEIEPDYFVQQIPKDKFLSKIPYLKKFSQNNNKEIRYTTDVDKTKAKLDEFERRFKNHLDPNRPNIEVKSITDIPSSLSIADIPHEYANLFANDVPYANNRNIFSKIFNSNSKDLIHKRNAIINTKEVHNAIDELKKNPEYRKLEQDIEQKYSNLSREARKNGDEKLVNQILDNRSRELRDLWNSFGMRAKYVRPKLKQEILNKKANISTGKHGDVRDLDLTDLVLAGYNVPNESKLNKVVREINKNKVLKSYLENMQGRDIYASPFFGIINTLTGGVADINKAKEKKPSLVELYGLDKD